MSDAVLRTEQEVEQIYSRQVDTIYRICFLYLKNKTDAEDAVQAVFLKLMESGPAFENTAHEKAWLIVTATNHCKNILKHWFRKTVTLQEGDSASYEEPFRIDETLEKVLRLPNNYKTALYLFYYEGYTSAEIARMFPKKDSTIRSYLHKGRKLLKLQIEGEER